MSPGEAVVRVSTTVAPAPVELTAVDWSTALAGVVGADTAAEARLEDAVYIDLGGDERVELVIPVGRARRGGGVVLAAAPGGARLAGSFLAPSSTVGVLDGALEVTEPSFRTEDSLCCPSAWSHRTYTFDGERMQLQQAWLTADVAGAVATVQRYYDLLNRRDFGAAYDLLHPTVQAATPVESWAALVGRNLTVRVVDAAAVAGDGPRTVPTGTPVGVAVTREVVRQDDAGQPQPLAERGTWTLVYSGERQRWELTEEHLTSPRP